MSVMVTAVIQARMDSTRLPGKVLRELAGQSVLSHVIQRAYAARRIDRVVVATTTSAKDDVVEREVQRLGVRCTRGSETDVLNRYVLAFNQHGGTVGVRLTADCPFLAPDLIDQAVDEFLATNPDYLSNTVRRSFPRGLDVEVFDVDALREADRETRVESDREHVTPFLYRNTPRFSARHLVRSDPNRSADWRFTLDTEADWRFLEAVVRALHGRAPANVSEIDMLIYQRPELREINGHIAQKAF